MKTASTHKLKLLVQLRYAMRVKHYSLRSFSYRILLKLNDNQEPTHNMMPFSGAVKYMPASQRRHVTR